MSIYYILNQKKKTITITFNALKELNKRQISVLTQAGIKPFYTTKIKQKIHLPINYKGYPFH